MPIYKGDVQIPEPNNVILNADDTIKVFVGPTQVYPAFTGAVLTADATNFPAAGGTINLTAQGSGTPPLTFDFQELLPAGAWTSFQNSATATAARALTVDGVQYRCVITDADTNALTSNVIAVRVWAAPTFEAGSGPLDQTVAQGATATFSVTVIAYEPTYQWRRDGVDIAGATGASYTTPAVDFNADNGSTYDCVVTDGFAQVGNSAVATLTVNAGAPTASVTPTTVDVPENTAVTWTCAATGYGTLTYQWQFNGVDVGGEVGTTYTRTLVLTDNGSNVTCVVTDQAGVSVTSNASTILVDSQLPVLPPHAPSGATAYYIAVPQYLRNPQGQVPVVGDEIQTWLPASGFGPNLNFNNSTFIRSVLDYDEVNDRYRVLGVQPLGQSQNLSQYQGEFFNLAPGQSQVQWAVFVNAIPLVQQVPTNVCYSRDPYPDDLDPPRGDNLSIIPSVDSTNAANTLVEFRSYLANFLDAVVNRSVPIVGCHSCVETVEYNTGAPFFDPFWQGQQYGNCNGSTIAYTSEAANRAISTRLGIGFLYEATALYEWGIYTVNSPGPTRTQIDDIVADRQSKYPAWEGTTRFNYSPGGTSLPDNGK